MSWHNFLTVSIGTSNADDRLKFLSLPYLDSARKMHSNESEQDYIFFFLIF